MHACTALLGLACVDRLTLPAPHACSELAGNDLTGELPPQWAGLAQLQVLNASANQLSGGLPGQWEALQALRVLKLAENQLSVRAHLPHWCKARK